jgi:hypothetical protein
LTDLIDGSTASVPSDAQGRLKNSQDIKVRISAARPFDKPGFRFWFSWLLNSSGYYFSGVFEKNTSASTLLQTDPNG